MWRNRSVGLLARAHCFVGRISEVTNIYPSLKLMVFVDDITTFMNARTKELLQLAEKVFKTLKREGKAGKSISRLKYVQSQRFFTSLCTGSKMLR